MLRIFTTIVALAVVSLLALLAPPGRDGDAKRMSFHNRLLLNRAVVTGLDRIEVLLLTGPSIGPETWQIARLAATVVSLGGRVIRTEPSVGYLRVEVPTAHLLEIVSRPAVAAYQISSLSRASWYRDGPPMANATMFRGFEAAPVAAAEARTQFPDLPLLTSDDARAPGFTADEDVGLRRWREVHPTFDGRGVTIALVESGLPSFTDPTLRTAKTLDGMDVPKIAGIVNAIDTTHEDESRVTLTEPVASSTTWARLNDRTYVLPRPGRYRAGVFEVPAGNHLVHLFAVLAADDSSDIWIDSDGDASFDDETPLADVNERFEPRELTLLHPRKARVSFVMARGRQPNVVHIYVGKGGHQTMTASVAAGARTQESLASGVAPNARLLFVRKDSAGTGLGKIFEGFIEAAQHPAVDVISASAGITLVPDTADAFAALLFERLLARYGKPIVNSAGNTSQQRASAHAFGSTVTAGGVLGPATLAAFHGGRPLLQPIVHHMSGAGPALDGAIKPDVLAPSERLAADVPWSLAVDGVPRNDPKRRVPPGYQVSCCTSASSPYAAGVIALLISAAKQSNVSYSSESINRALRFSAQPLPRFQSHEQGNGVLNVAGAWQYLRDAPEVPRIEVVANVVHPLAQYAAGGSAGVGLYEVDGWQVGMRGRREIRLRRVSGPDRPLTYRLEWLSSDGTFRSPADVTLPFRSDVRLPIDIDAATPGVHSGILQLRDRKTGAIVRRTQATIVVAESAEPDGAVRVRGIVGYMRHNAHHVTVPAGTAALAVELEVRRGVVRPTILPSHGLFPSYYPHVHPANVRFVGKGRYEVVLPVPQPGTWTIQISSGSTWFRIGGDTVQSDDGDGEYALTVRTLQAPLHATAGADGSINIGVTAAGSLGDPEVQVTGGTLRSHDIELQPSGLPNVVDIQVPAGASALSLALRAASGGIGTELYLYDCTTGECFSYDIGFPAATTQSMVVRNPAAGRWVAAINTAPFAGSTGRALLDEIIAVGPPARHAVGEPISTATRQELLKRLSATSEAGAGRPILLIELIDAALQRAESQFAWTPGAGAIPLRDRPVAIGRTIYKP